MFIKKFISPDCYSDDIARKQGPAPEHRDMTGMIQYLSLQARNVCLRYFRPVSRSLAADELTVQCRLSNLLHSDGKLYRK